MVIELPKTPPPMIGKTSLPPIFKAEVTLSLIMTDFAVDLSVRQLLLVRVFFNQSRPEL